jgi:hypothetical protein
MKLKLAMGLLIVVTASLIATCVAQNDENVCTMNVQDKQSAVNTTFTNQRNMPWCEIIMSCGDTNISGFYGTVGLNEPNDSCPYALSSSFDSQAVAKQYKADTVVINPASGRKFWLLDKMVIPVSPTVHDFDGLKGHWWAEMTGKVVEMPPYVPASIARKSVWTFEKGKPVFLLDDPNGTTWILKNYATTVDPTITYETLPTLGTKLKLPEGWKNFRTKVLDQDLTVQAVNGTARIMWDELEQSWDACDPGVCTPMP